MKRKPREKILLFPATATVECIVVAETPRLYRVRTHSGQHEMLVDKKRVKIDARS